MDDERRRRLEALIVDCIREEICDVIGEPHNLRWPPEVTLAGVCNQLSAIARDLKLETAKLAPMILAGYNGVVDEDVQSFRVRWGEPQAMPAWDSVMVCHVERVLNEALRVPHPLYRRSAWHMIAAYSVMAGVLAHYRDDQPSSVVERVAATIQRAQDGHR